jgi:cytochrome b6-f complex iron-sulfur subunit/menaquinol-cytochrome c reductase iron-sulfur subunit
MTEGRKAADEGRRRLLKVLVGTSSATFACALAGPAAVFVAAPAKSRAAGDGSWVKTIRLDALPEGEPRKVSIVADERDAWTLTKNVELGAAWLVRKGDTILALSTICPHLGCSVNVAPVTPGDTPGAPGGRGFACPCHTSTFDAAGHRTGGPSPRGMDPLETRVEAGFVVVDFRRYRMGIPERVQVG